jgi:hypothetical protein
MTYASVTFLPRKIEKSRQRRLVNANILYYRDKVTVYRTWCKGSSTSIASKNPLLSLYTIFKTHLVCVIAIVRIDVGLPLCVAEFFVIDTKNIFVAVP